MVRRLASCVACADRKHERCREKRALNTLKATLGGDLQPSIRTINIKQDRGYWGNWSECASANANANAEPDSCSGGGSTFCGWQDVHPFPKLTWLKPKTVQQPVLRTVPTFTLHARERRLRLLALTNGYREEQLRDAGAAFIISAFQPPVPVPVPVPVAADSPSPQGVQKLLPRILKRLSLDQFPMVRKDTQAATTPVPYDPFAVAHRCETLSARKRLPIISSAPADNMMYKHVFPVSSATKRGDKGSGDGGHASFVPVATDDIVSVIKRRTSARSVDSKPKRKHYLLSIASAIRQITESTPSQLPFEVPIVSGIRLRHRFKHDD